MTQASSSLIQVAGICDSLRQGSFTKMALQVALDVRSRRLIYNYLREFFMK